MTALATADHPAFCGEAEIVARGIGPRADCVVRMQSGGAYYGAINFDVYFVGDELQRGPLWAAGNFFFLVRPDLPLAELKAAMQTIPLARDMESSSRTNRATGDRIEVQVYRDYPDPHP